MNTITIEFDKNIDKRKTLSFDDMKRIVSQIVFRDTAISIIGERWEPYLMVSRDCTDRSRDRKLPYQKVPIVSAYVRDLDPITPMDYEGLRYPIYEENTKLQGTFPIPELHETKYFLEFVLRAIKNAEDHEIEENFYYMGQRVFDPHLTEPFEWENLQRVPARI